jgi:formate hydrogenlyase subunit 6/NADH:ubiquinone oxidoreductase subunit I
MPLLRSLAHLLSELGRTLRAERITVQFPFAPAELPAVFRGRVTIVDETLCKGCGLCARDCPALALELERYDREHFRLIHYRDRCAYCGQCADCCPSHVIVLSNELVSPTQERGTLTQILVERTSDPTG